MDSSFVSEHLFHLVGFRHPADDDKNLAILKAILREGRVKYRQDEPDQVGASLMYFPNRSLATGEMVVPKCTCFCDIPIAHLEFHARKYGRFGVSFHRTFLIRAGARPVMYLPKWNGDSHSANGTTILKETQLLYRAFKERFIDPMIERARERRRALGQKPKKDDEIVDGMNKVLLFYLLAFMKPYDSDLPPDHIDYFYSEREWRLTNHLWFAPADVTSVVVSSEEHGREVKKEFPAYSGKIHVLR